MLKFFCCFIFVANVITFSAEVGASGFDSIECDPHSSRARTGRARLIASIPCDLTKQSYCNLPGEFYPWNAVKKFVYENQGLVRRMYGDLRHIFVMQSELENEIDSDDDMKHFADKYSKAFNSQQRKHQSRSSKNDEKHNNKRQMKAKKVAAAAASASASDRKNYRSEGEPYFRPAQRPSAINSKQKTKPPRVNEQVDNNNVLNVVDDLIKNNEEQIADNMRSKTEITSSSTTHQTSTISTSTVVTADSMNNRSMSSSTETPQSSSTKSPISSAESMSLSSTPSSSTSSLSPQTSLVDSNVNGNDQSRDFIPSSSTTSTTSSDIPPSPQTYSTTISTETDDESEIAAAAIVEELVKEVETELRDASSVFSSDTNNASSSSVFSSSNEPPTTTTEAQLFQDTIFKEKEPPEPVIINRRGVNACPVKEEVVAPFWANNTRGEVLALLNVYPFEQYIHWEKCTHEHEQMYCRRGCKCEQQHRLHRLLAYNPLDACRGIFSDWFRFPSCCICKCYDIPFDFRVTSRSPRGTDKLIDDEDDDNSNNNRNSEEVEKSDIEVNVETDDGDGRITFSASDDVDINFYNQDHEDDF